MHFVIVSLTSQIINLKILESVKVHFLGVYSAKIYEILSIQLKDIKIIIIIKCY